MPASQHSVLVETQYGRAIQASEETSRYRREKDEGARADWPDTAADTPGSAASTRLIAHGADANWDRGAASATNNIYLDYSQKLSAT